MSTRSRDQVRVQHKVRIEVEVDVAVDKDGVCHYGQNAVVSNKQIEEALTRVDSQKDIWELATQPKEGYLRSYFRSYFRNVWTGSHYVSYDHVTDVTEKFFSTNRRFDRTKSDHPFDSEDIARETGPEAVKKWRDIRKAAK